MNKFLVFSLCLIFKINTFAQQFVEPSIGTNSWVASDSTHIGLDANLKYLYKIGSFFIGADAQYTKFNETFKDKSLMDTNWMGYSVALKLGLFLEQNLISVSYVPFDRINTDKTKQYVSENSIATISDFTLKGSGYVLTYGLPLSETFFMSFSFKRISYEKQSFSSSSSDKPIDMSINSISVSVGIPISLGFDSL